MRRSSIAFLGVSLAAFLFAVSTASAAPRGQKSVAEGLQEEQDLIVNECKLTDQQQAAIKEKFKLKQNAMEAWEKANAEKLKAAEDAAKLARQGTDESAKRKANDDLRTLTTSRTEAASEADKAILAVLSDEQKIAVAGIRLAQATLPRYRKANPTDEQVGKIKAACAIAARDLSAFAGDDKKDKQGRTTIQKSLKWAIDNVILTPEQRALVAPKAATPPAK